jgi:thiol-disulfide isomerase/thioredoxin
MYSIDVIPAVSLGPLLIPVKPLTLILGLLFAIWLSGRLGNRFHLEKVRVRRIAEYSAWFGLFGARLSFVVMNWDAYRPEPWAALYLWQPGYLFLGGLLTGFAYAIWRVAGVSSELRRHVFISLAGAYLAAGVLFSAILLSTGFFQKPGVARVGDAIPEFTLQNLAGGTVRFSDLEGRAVILNFWATWCPPCRREMPLLDEMQKVYGEKGLSVIGVDVNEPTGLVKSYVESIGVSYAVWVYAPDGAQGFDITQQLFSTFGGVGYPFTLFIDRSGVIRQVYVGELSRGFLHNQIEEILIPE